MRSINAWHSLFKYPFLTLGVLMLGTLFYHLHKNGILQTRAEKLNPRPCTAAIVMLNKRAPSTWQIRCDDNQLLITIPFTPDVKINMKDDRVARMIHLRELANQLSYISQNSGNEQLSRTSGFAVLLESDRMAVEAAGSGKDLSMLVDRITPDEVMTHLMRFQVKEKLK